MLVLLLFAVVFFALAWVVPGDSGRIGKIIFVVLGVLCAFFAFAGHLFPAAVIR